MHGDKSLVKLALPRDRNSIRRSTYLLRQKLGLKDTPYFPIVEFLENVLPEIDPTFHIEMISYSHSIFKYYVNFSYLLAFLQVFYNTIAYVLQ